MDIISHLPVEISHKILHLFPIRDLFKFMAVCKSWRDIINSNYFWRHFYILLDIEVIDEDDVPKEETCAFVPLCSRAKELKNYILSPAYNWRREKCQHFYINLEYRQWMCVCSEPYLAIIYICSNELHIYHTTQNSIERRDIVSINLPKNSLEQPVLMNSKYIVVGSYNITHVFKLGEESFILFKTFALKYDPILYYSDDDFGNFVEQNILPNHCVFERVLVDDTLWITDINGIKHIVDLTTGDITSFSSLYLCTKVLPTSKFILNFIGVNVQITDPEGSIVSSFSISHESTSFYINPRIMTVIFPKILDNDGMFPVECREITTGDMIRKISVPVRTRISLHSTKDILHFLNTSSDLYTVSSFCVRTGNYLWKYQMNSEPRKFYGSFLSTIGNRYLVIHPSPSSDYCYALFDLKGKFLCDSSFTSGVILYISDALYVAKEDGRLHVTHF